MKTLNKKVFAMLGVGLSLALAVASTPIASAATISSYMGVGSRGSDVITLQTYLAGNPSFYPQGLITGYFGPLTRAAVIRFQAFYGIPTVGRVGPITLAKLNSLLSGGMTGDMSAPLITSVSVSPSTNYATVTWMTSEVARAKVFYDTRPVSMLEVSADFTEPAVLNGLVASDTSFKNSESIMLQNLQPNTTYYFVVESIDSTGNVSVSTQQTFRTNI